MLAIKGKNIYSLYNGEMILASPAQQIAQPSLTIPIAVIGLVVLVFILAQIARRSMLAWEARRTPPAENNRGLPAPWRALRQEVDRANQGLTPAVFARARQIFVDFYAAGGTTPAELTREYPTGDNAGEFLLVVDEQGLPYGVDAIMAGFQVELAAHPAFARWFRADSMLDGQPVLLAARWLCHLVGLRHDTVEIFIDPPGLDGQTLAQVRGMGKFEAPGAFDIPCAGHVSGVDSPDASLAKELVEELNLALDDLEDLSLVARYNSIAPRREDGQAINNEHRVLYRARLKAEAAGHIRFTDGEVAGLCVFAVDELRALVEKYPERVASGLADAMAYYQTK